MRRSALVMLLSAVSALAVLWSMPTRTAEAQDGQWATVKGRIVFGGTQVPAREKINPTQDKDHCLSKGALLEEKWIVDPKTNAVKNVYVWLGPDSVRSDAKFEPEQIHPALAKVKNNVVEMDQPCCMFEPHCVAMREGQKLVVKNSAPVPHNVNWTSRSNGNGNLGTPPGGKVEITAPNQPGLVADRYPLLIKCNVHPWMNAWVRVYDHPYYALTNEKGEFEIKMAPADTVRLFVWHEEVGFKGGRLGARGDKITLKAGENDLGDLKIGE